MELLPSGVIGNQGDGWEELPGRGKVPFCVGPSAFLGNERIIPAPVALEREGGVFPRDSLGKSYAGELAKIIQFFCAANSPGWKTVSYVTWTLKPAPPVGNISPLPRR